MNIEDIERLAFLKYKLSGKKSMNTFIFTQVKNNKLQDKEIDKLINNLNKKISRYTEKQISEINYTCNIFK